MNKMLWVTWRDNSTRRRYIIGELLYLDNKYTFKYVNPECDEARKCGFNGYPVF